ncbi:DNA polymerase III subunit delta' [Pantoea alhagi]|uniref:DNA polymerase III subunit delta' n=1 Tax=Pantoea alhagi TaxID=1891675 RepID=A0A1W6BAA5_9GAMM|nr:DNA polymerase III subunit delta' [Pantoea alhagi]ARJ44056.1 DNA polymerase III subunit delta' [Pantoea alhagi]
MNWYPWLNPVYRQLVAQHQAGRAHHAVLVQALPGMGDAALIWAVSRWLLCQRRDGQKSCGHCHGCQLMMAGTHPDWHRLTAEKGKSALGIDAVRDVNETLYHHAQQGGAKVVWLPDAGQLTEAAANALLKTLEEPPQNSWFFLSSAEPSRLLPTLRSRCLKLHLAPPDEAHSLGWLQKQNAGSHEAMLTALRLSSGAPAAALALLDKQNWEQRQTLCATLASALIGDVLTLLPQLNHDNVAERISWLASLLTDALKWQHSGDQFIANVDQPALITQLAQRLPAAALDKSLRQWLLCRERLIHIVAVNRELLLTEQLLNWETLLRPASTSLAD